MILGKFASEIFLPNRIIIKLKCEAPFNGGTYINELGRIRALTFGFFGELKLRDVTDL